MAFDDVVRRIKEDLAAKQAQADQRSNAHREPWDFKTPMDRQTARQQDANWLNSEIARNRENALQAKTEARDRINQKIEQDRKSREAHQARTMDFFNRLREKDPNAPIPNGFINNSNDFKSRSGY